MRRLFAALALATLALAGIPSAAHAAVTDGATLGSWITTQSCGSHTFKYKYDVTQMAGSQKQLYLRWAEHSGSALSNWAPMVNSQMNGGLDKSLSGRGVYQQLGAVGSGTVRITRGDAAASGWSRVILNYAGTDTAGRKLVTNSSACNTSQFDFTSNTAPLVYDPTGSFTDRWTCTTGGYTSTWTAAYTITTVSAGHYLVTWDTITRVNETSFATARIEVVFPGQGVTPQIVQGGTANFGYGNGESPPKAMLYASWNGGVYNCASLDGVLLDGNWNGS